MKEKAIVDTCFLQKISNEGKCSGNIKRIFDNIEYIPVAHPYVVEHELKLHSYLAELINEGYISTVKYEDFLTDDFSKEVYEEQFIAIYDEMRIYLKTKGGMKQMPELVLSKDENIYSKHLSKSSMGDVHMILMASFLRFPVILSEDSDIELLRDIAKRRLSISSYQLKIYSIEDVLCQIAENNTDLSHKELETLVKQVGKKEKWNKINSIWHARH